MSFVTVISQFSLLLIILPVTFLAIKLCKPKPDDEPEAPAAAPPEPEIELQTGWVHPGPAPPPPPPPPTYIYPRDGRSIEEDPNACMIM